MKQEHYVMRIPRIFYPKNIALEQELVLDSNSSNHVLKVLRLSIGAKIIIFNGEGGEFKTTISMVKNNLAVIKVNEFIAKNLESSLKINLAQGIGRGEKMDYVIQKAVELGVHKIIPLFTEYCNVKLNDARLQNKVSRWELIIISACEQSGRNYIPSIEMPTHLSKWLTESRNSYNIILEPQAAINMKNLDIINYSEITILIGPEGGLSDIEVLLAQKNGFIPVRLGPRVLRTETAALVALSALQTRFGDF